MSDQTIKEQLRLANELVDKLQKELELINNIVEIDYNIGVVFKRKNSAHHYTLINLNGIIQLFSLNTQLYIGNPFPNHQFKDADGNVKCINFLLSMIFRL